MRRRDPMTLVELFAYWCKRNYQIIRWLPWGGRLWCWADDRVEAWSERHDRHAIAGGWRKEKMGSMTMLESCAHWIIHHWSTVQWLPLGGRLWLWAHNRLYVYRRRRGGR